MRSAAGRADLLAVSALGVERCCSISPLQRYGQPTNAGRVLRTAPYLFELRYRTEAVRSSYGHASGTFLGARASARQSRRRIAETARPATATKAAAANIVVTGSMTRGGTLTIPSASMTAGWRR